MRIAERHRLNPKKGKSSKLPSNVKIRKGGKKKELDVLYLNREVYEAPLNKAANFEELLEKLNSEFNLNLKNDSDDLLLEIFKRGWKVTALDLNIGRTYVIRFNRNVGGEKSRTYTKKSNSIKHLILLALEHILNHENNRYEQRMGKFRRRSGT